MYYEQQKAERKKSAMEENARRKAEADLAAETDKISTTNALGGSTMVDDDETLGTSSIADALAEEPSHAERTQEFQRFTSDSTEK